MNLIQMSAGRYLDFRHCFVSLFIFAPTAKESDDTALGNCDFTSADSCFFACIFATPRAFEGYQEFYCE